MGGKAGDNFIAAIVIVVIKGKRMAVFLVRSCHRALARKTDGLVWDTITSISSKISKHRSA